MQNVNAINWPNSSISKYFREILDDMVILSLDFLFFFLFVLNASRPSWMVNGSLRQRPARDAAKPRGKSIFRLGKGYRISGKWTRLLLAKESWNWRDPRRMKRQSIVLYMFYARLNLRTFIGKRQRGNLRMVKVALNHQQRKRPYPPPQWSWRRLLQSVYLKNVRSGWQVYSTIF